VTGGEENREPEAVAAEQVLVEKEHADVGTVPRNHHPYGSPRNLVHAFLNSRETIFLFILFLYEKLFGERAFWD